MTPHDVVDVSLLAETVGFSCPFYATREAIQLADLGEGDRDLAGGTVRVLELLTDAKNALLLNSALPEWPTSVSFRSTTLPHPADLQLALTWDGERPVRIDLRCARSN